MIKSRSFVPVLEPLNCTNSLNIWQESFIEYLLNNDDNPRTQYVKDTRKLTQINESTCLVSAANPVKKCNRKICSFSALNL